MAPYQTFDTLDSNRLLAIGSDGQCLRFCFCEAAGQPDWSVDARFASNTLRVKNREALLALMLPVTRRRSTAVGAAHR